MPASCPQKEQLAAYLLGELTTDTADAIAHHLEECPDCDATIADMENLEDTIIMGIRQGGEVPRYIHEPEFAAAKERIGAALSLVVGSSALADADSNNFDESHSGQIGHYQLLERLGEGGMGAVYKARHAKLKKIVALKVLAPDRVKQSQAVARFEQEMEAIGKLEHKHIVRATDAGELDGQHFLVMEFIEGVDVSKLVKSRGQLPIADACEIARQAAVGLQHAHHHDLVHRDIKPSNLMLAPSGEVKILDLGLARLRSEEAGRGELTADSQIMGTLDYMSPEQCRASHKVGSRADIYSLGATLYKLLSGTAPFGDQKYDTSVKKISATIADPVPPIQERRPEIPPELAELVAQMLAKDPYERPATLEEVGRRLEPFAAGADLAALLATTQSGKTTATSTKSSTSDYVPSSLEETSTKGVAVSPSASRPQFSPAWQGRRVWIAAAVLLLIGVAMGVHQVVIRVFKPDQPPVTLNVPGGTEVDVRPNGDVDIRVPDSNDDNSGGSNSTDANNRTSGQAPPVKLVPVREPTSKGQPLFETAPVTAPAKIEGVKSWTIDTVGHRGTIYRAAYCPDGKLVATAGRDGLVRIWDLGDRRLSRAFTGTEFQWFPDSRRIVTWKGNDRFHVRDVATGQLLQTVAGHGALSPGWARSASSGQLESYEGRATFSPDCRLLATGNFDGEVRISDVETAESLHVLKHGETRITQLAWSWDGTRLASGCTGDGRTVHPTVKIWDVDRGKELHTLPADPKDARTAVLKLEWSHVGNTLAIWASDTQYGPMTIWDTDPKSKVAELRFGQLRGLTWSPIDLSLAIDYGNDHVPAEWWKLDAKTGEFSRAAFLGRRRWTNAVAWAPKADKVAIVGEDRTVLLQSTKSNAEQIIQNGHWHTMSQFAWSPDGRRLAVASGDGVSEPKAISVWDVSHGKLLNSLERPETARNLPWSDQPSWSPDSRAFVAGQNIWDVETGVTPKLGMPDGGTVWSSSLSPDGKHVALSDKRTNLTILDARSLKLVRELAGPSHSGTVNPPRISWSPNGRIVAANYRVGEASAYLWDLATGKILHRLVEGHDIRCFAWSPDSRLLATGLEYGDVVIWDVGRGEIRDRIDTDVNIHQLHWLPGGDELALLFEFRGKVESWNMRSLEKVRTIDGLPPGWMRLSPDAKFVAIGTPDCSLNLWQLEPKRVIGTFAALSNDRFVSLTPDGHYRGSEGIESELIYFGEADDGTQLTLTQQQFTEKYGWKNDAEKVRFFEQ